MQVGQRVRIPSGPTGLTPRHNLLGVVVGPTVDEGYWLVQLDRPVSCECDGSTLTVIVEADDNMERLDDGESHCA
jgi:hypothetical protein